VAVPPRAYGGTEMVVDGLARGFLDAGHEVLLYTTGDSTCPVPRAFTLPRAVGTVNTGAATELHHVIEAYEAVTAWGADVVHDHTLVGPVYAERFDVPVVTTNHGPFDGELGALYQAGSHGGEIVYSYAGGVGTRSGSPEDVSRLFLAGLYQQALADRQAGRLQEATRLIDQAAARFPENIEVKLAQAESILLDRKDAGGAIGVLQAIRPPADNRPLRVRHAVLTADALVASGQRDGAAAVLQQVLTEGPSVRAQQKLDEITQKGGPAPKQ